jgi:pimeloyl-ACP methyl ester carboxylesterase
MHLLLLPGMDGTGELFAPLQEALAIRLPNLGITAVRYPAARSSYLDLLATAREAFECAPKPCIVLGESFSGPIAIGLAAEQPVGLAAIVLCCTFASAPRVSMQALTRVFARPLSRTPSWMFSNPLSSAIAGRMLLGRWANPEIAEQLRGALRQLPPATLAARLQSVANCDCVASLASVQCPSLVLSARDDRLLPEKAALQLLAGLPNAQRVCLDGPHGLLQCRASAAAQAIGSFVVARGLISA